MTNRARHIFNDANTPPSKVWLRKVYRTSSTRTSWPSWLKINSINTIIQQLIGATSSNIDSYESFFQLVKTSSALALPRVAFHNLERAPFPFRQSRTSNEIAEWRPTMVRNWVPEVVEKKTRTRAILKVPSSLIMALINRIVTRAARPAFLAARNPYVRISNIKNPQLNW